MSLFNCDTCGASCFEAALYRVNKKGVPGLFQCERCLQSPPETKLKEVCDIIQSGKEDKNGNII